MKKPQLNPHTPKNGLRGVESDGYSWHYISIARLGTRLWKCDSERNYRKGGRAMFDTGLTVGILIGVLLGILGTVLFFDIMQDKSDKEG